MTLVSPVVVTCLLFLALPFTQFIEGLSKKARDIDQVDVALPPPPPPPVEPPPPAEEEQQEEKPELSEPPPPLSLAQLEVALNPGTGGVTGDFGFAQFQANFDVMEEIGVFEMSELDTIPQPIHRVAPTFPPAMKQKGVSGHVTVIIIVDEEGRVTQPRIEESTHFEFEKPVIDAVLQWKFKPGVKDGKNVKTRMRLPLRFDLTVRR